MLKKSAEERGCMRFLVVDDNADAAKMLSMLLMRHFDAVIDVASSGSEARAALERTAYDVVTLDYQLPDTTGLDLLDEITAAEEHPPVVMITGHGDEELAYLSFRMGAAGYASKDRKLSVVLPDAIEWALADAVHKRAQAAGTVADSRLDGLVEASHSTARNLRIELDSVKSALGRIARACEGLPKDESTALKRAASAAEKSLARSYNLVDKLDSLVQPGKDAPAEHLREGS